MTASPDERIAAAPISWGVCEVPGWGHQMDPGRVLGEMAALGVTATEFGPPGFLPAEPAARTAVLAEHGLRAVGGFLALVLHDDASDPVATVREELGAYVASAADTVVLAAATGREGYEERVALTADEWRTLFGNIDEIGKVATDLGVRAVLHPHVGTVVERPDEVRMVLDSSDVSLCLDTGHLLAGGGDPVALARDAADRVAHVHLKDVRYSLAEPVRAGELGYFDAVRRGLYAALGAGDIDIAAIVASLQAAGYSGWYVLEQDCVLDAEPAPDAGPRADVAASMAFIAGLAPAVGERAKRSEHR